MRLVLQRAGVEAGDPVAGSGGLGEETLGERETEAAALVLGGDEHPLHLAGPVPEVTEGDAAGGLVPDQGEEQPAGGWSIAAGERGELGLEGGRVEVAVEHRPMRGVAPVVPADVAPHQGADGGEVGGVGRLANGDGGHRVPLSAGAATLAAAPRRAPRQRGDRHRGAAAKMAAPALRGTR